MTMTGRIFGLHSNNKGLTCPFRKILCQQGLCTECYIYEKWKCREGRTIKNYSIYEREKPASIQPGGMGQFLRSRRIKSGLTLLQLSLISGIPVAHLYRVETGQSQVSVSVLRKLAGHIGISQFELLTYPPYLQILDRKKIVGKQK